MLPQARKVIDEGCEFISVDAIDARYKAGVLGTRKIGVGLPPSSGPG